MDLVFYQHLHSIVETVERRDRGRGEGQGEGGQKEGGSMVGMRWLRPSEADLCMGSI